MKKETKERLAKISSDITHQYPGIIKIIELAITVLLGVVSIMNSCATLKLSEIQTQMLQEQAKREIIQLTDAAVFQMKPDGTTQREIIEGKYASVSTFIVSQDGSRVKECVLLPITYVRVLYNGTPITKIGLNYFVKSEYDLDIESKNFRIEKYNTMCDSAIIFEDIINWISIKSQKGKSWSKPELEKYFDKSKLEFDEQDYYIILYKDILGERHEEYYFVDTDNILQVTSNISTVCNVVPYIEGLEGINLESDVVGSYKLYEITYRNAADIIAEDLCEYFSKSGSENS